MTLGVSGLFIGKFRLILKDLALDGPSLRDFYQPGPASLRISPERQEIFQKK